jgi:hypothetical protein
MLYYVQNTRAVALGVNIGLSFTIPIINFMSRMDE